MRLLVTGAGGMLGRDVVRSAAAEHHEPIALARADLDVTDPRAVRRRVLAEAPDAVVNCAAFTDVDGAESAAAEAMRVNAEGAGHMAAAAAEAGATVVQVSTDYVFDGRAGRPYVESDAPSPASAYGRSKLAGERAVAAANPRHLIVRSSWLFGTGGPNFVDTMLGLGRDRSEVLVVRDQVGCPTYTGHLSAALVRLAATEASGIHHVAAAGECSWYELAVAAFARAGLDTRVMSCTTAELARPAPRPPYSVLETERDPALRLPDWREGLDAYLAERSAVAAR